MIGNTKGSELAVSSILTLLTEINISVRGLAIDTVIRTHIMAGLVRGWALKDRFQDRPGSPQDTLLDNLTVTLTRSLQHIRCREPLQEIAIAILPAMSTTPHRFVRLVVRVSSRSSYPVRRAIGTPTYMPLGRMMQSFRRRILDTGALMIPSYQKDVSVRHWTDAQQVTLSTTILLPTSHLAGTIAAAL